MWGTLRYSHIVSVTLIGPVTKWPDQSASIKEREAGVRLGFSCVLVNNGGCGMDAVLGQFYQLELDKSSLKEEWKRLFSTNYWLWQQFSEHQSAHLLLGVVQ